MTVVGWKFTLISDTAKFCHESGMSEDQVHEYAAVRVDAYCDEMLASGKWTVLKTREMKDALWDSAVDSWEKLKNDGKRVRVAKRGHDLRVIMESGKGPRS